MCSRHGSTYVIVTAHIELLMPCPWISFFVFLISWILIMWLQFFVFFFQNKVPLLSVEAIHHLHIFIFVLAVVHVTYCVLTVFFGGLKVSILDTSILNHLCPQFSFFINSSSLLYRYVSGSTGRIQLLKTTTMRHRKVKWFDQLLQCILCDQLFN